MITREKFILEVLENTSSIYTLEDIISFFKEMDSTIEEISEESLEEFIDNINTEDDFYLEIWDKEYRFINENFIEEKYEEYIYDFIEEQMSSVSEPLKNFFMRKFDAEDYKYYFWDSYGNCFAFYDWIELSYKDYYIFRTN